MDCEDLYSNLETQPTTTETINITTDDKLQPILMVSFVFNIVMTTEYTVPNDNIIIKTFHLGIIFGSQQDTPSEVDHTSVK